jgi:acyl-[acyl carrier protein]--UDP-N-acetylglucosamine O-acyltransferase
MIKIHPTSDVQSAAIGHGTRIWQFCVILSEAIIGDDYQKVRLIFHFTGMGLMFYQ